MLLQEALSAHEAQSSGVTAERAALRADLERLLRERGTLDSLKRVVAAAVKTQQVGKAVSSFVMLSAPVRALPLCVRTVLDSSPLASHMACQRTWRQNILLHSWSPCQYKLQPYMHT